MKPNPEPGTRLLKYRSKSTIGFGVEVVAGSGAEVHHLFEDLQWLVAGSGLVVPPDFFVVEVPHAHDASDFQLIAKAASAKGLAEKVCLIVPLNHRLPNDVLSALMSHGVRILLGGVGIDARFADLLQSYADGIVFEAALISGAAGDPQMASVLEAACTLAMNLGLRTFASRCFQAEFDVALDCGVNYLSLEADAESGARAAVAALTGTSVAPARGSPAVARPRT